MTVSEAIAARRSVRAFETRPVEPEALRAILEAGRLAPSARNDQNWQFVVVQDRVLLDKMFDAVNRQPFMENVPAIIAVVATSSRAMACGVETGVVNASIAMSFMVLQAQELGLGTCWLGFFDQDKARSVLGVPESAEIIAITPIGYPAKDYSPRPRKAFDEVVSFDGFKYEN